MSDQILSPISYPISLIAHFGCNYSGNLNIEINGANYSFNLTHIDSLKKIFKKIKIIKNNMFKNNIKYELKQNKIKNLVIYDNDNNIISLRLLRLDSQISILQKLLEYKYHPKNEKSIHNYTITMTMGKNGETTTLSQYMPNKLKILEFQTSNIDDVINFINLDFATPLLCNDLCKNDDYSVCLQIKYYNYETYRGSNSNSYDFYLNKSRFLNFIDNIQIVYY